MYVIATVFCSNFHFSVSLHVPFSQFLFERDSYSNEYLVAKIGFDTAEHGPLKVSQKVAKRQKKWKKLEQTQAATLPSNSTVASGVGDEGSAGAASAGVPSKLN